MGKTIPTLTPDLIEFIEAQHVFFVATAPLAPDGHVNCSPKGQDTLRVLSPTRIAYLDLTGSGNETSAHVTENGRITLMLCAFDGPPRILRLYGRGTIVLPGADAWTELAPRFPDLLGTRQIVVVEIDRIQTSCGYAVPRMEFAGERDTLTRWSERKGEEGLRDYREQKNRRSIDGLPAPLVEEVE